MTYFLNSIFLVLILGVMGGCSTWTADKCQSTNWDSMGYADGSNGKNNSAGLYSSKCLKKGVNINNQAYDQGYQRGLTAYCNYNKGHQTAFTGQLKEPICSPIPDYNKGYAKGTLEYCTEDTGYKVAIDGGPEAKICTGNAANAFMKGYKKGRAKFVVEEIENLKEDLSKATKDLNEVRDQLADKQNQLSRIPQYTYEPSVIRLREELQADVINLTATRNEIRSEVDKIDARLKELEREARAK